MTAYLLKILEGLKIIPTLKEWNNHTIVSKESCDKIDQHYSNDLYIPNIFIRIGLFLFTCILASAIFGLISAITWGGSSNIAISIRLFFYSILTFIALEHIINSKKMYRSGVDDALLYIGLIFYASCLGFLILDTNDSSSGILLLLVFLIPVLIITAIRYVDMLVTAAVFCSIFALLFHIVNVLSSSLLSLLPFVGMAVSACIYILTKKNQNTRLLAWWDNLIVLEVLSLFTFYLSGNYLIVRELSIELMNIEVTPENDIPLAILFYIFTSVIPFLYLYQSIKVKDRIMLRCGLIIFALGILTFKYYYSLGHHEISLTLAGIFLIVSSWSIMKFLRNAKNGITALKDETLVNTDIEGFVIAESFKSDPASLQTNNFKYGGGQSGGGGSSGSY